VAAEGAVDPDEIIEPEEPGFTIRCDWEDVRSRQAKV
jgi:hypothetical protein